MSTTASLAVRGSFLVAGLPILTDPIVQDRDDALHRGIRAVLAGAPTDALDHLTRAVTEGDPVTRARAAAWGAYVASLRANAFPGGIVGGGVELVGRAAELWRHPTAESSGEVADEVALERELLTTLLPRLRLARTWLGPTALAPDREEVVRDALAAVDVVEALAVAATEVAVVGFCRRSRADLLHRGGDHEASAEALAGAFDHARGDRFATAAVHLLVGDLALAPATHPDGADHALFDGGLETSALPWGVERQEADPAASSPGTAEAAYASAAAELDGADPVAAAVLTLRRAGVARVRGEHTDAVELADRAVAAARRGGDRWLACTASVHGLLARVAAGAPVAGSPAAGQVGRWGASTGSFSHAFGLGLLLARAGRSWLVRSGDVDRAATTHGLARELFAALGAAVQVSQSLADEGAVAAIVGTSATAINRYEEAYGQHLGRARDPIRGADAWRRAAGLALRVHGLRLAGDDGPQLRRSAARLAEISVLRPPGTDDAGSTSLRELADHLRSSAEVHAVLAEGDAARDRGDDEVARERFEAALAAAEDSGDDLGRAVTLARLRRTPEAAAAYRDHEAATAADLARRLEALREQLGDAAEPVIAQLDQRSAVLRRAGAFHTRIGSYDDAAAAFDTLDDEHPTWWAEEEHPWLLLSDHGRVREERGELARAEELHDLASDALISRGTSVARDELRTALNAGSALILGRAARTALRLAESGGEPLGEHAARSFLLAERGRARALAELLRVGATAGADHDRDDPVGRWVAASSQAELAHQLLAAERASSAGEPERVDALRAQVERAEAELAARADDLRRARPTVAEAVTPPDPPSIAEVAGLLPPRTVLVSHLLVDDDLLAWAVGPDGLRVATRRRLDARRLAAELGAFAAGCASGGPWAEAGRAAAGALLEPLREAIADVDRLYLVPTGVGHAAPLQALPWGDGVLGDHATVAVLPSVTTLRHLTVPRTPPPSPVLVVGDPEDPVLSRSGAPPVPAAPLPGARVEAAAVAAHHPGSRLLLGGDATAAHVLSQLDTARWMHVAAHAAVDAAAPLASAVLLAHGDQLRVADLMGRHLVAELIVLSACDSGRGVTTGGDEVLGMTRAILAAGASAALVSLWPVDDRSTAVMVARFSALVADGVDPSAALQRAQRWFRALDADGRSRAFAELAADDGLAAAEGSAGSGAGLRGIVRSTTPETAPVHPFHWAGFVYVGAHPGG